MHQTTICSIRNGVDSLSSNVILDYFNGQYIVHDTLPSSPLSYEFESIVLSLSISLLFLFLIAKFLHLAFKIQLLDILRDIVHLFAFLILLYLKHI